MRRVAPYVLEAEKQARTVEVEAELDNPQEAQLLPGYSADIEVVLEELERVLRIPTRALIEGNKVYVFDPEDDLVHLREIKVGLGNWEYTEVIAGLREHKLIVTPVDREGLVTEDELAHTRAQNQFYFSVVSSDTAPHCI